jgi:spore coat protein SA
MPTVALIGPELYPIPPIRGGATELFIDSLAAHLTRWRPVVIGVGDPELPAHEIRGRVEYYRIPLAGVRRWLYARYRHYFPFYDRRVAAIIRQVRPDLLHVHNRPLLAASLKKLGCGPIPMLLHMHNLYHSLGRRERPVSGTAPTRLEGFLACSRFVLDQERDRLGAGAARHWVIYNGVAAQAFANLREQPEQVRQARQAYGLGEAPTILFAGKLRESKGVGVLMNAMAGVWAKLPNATLVLVGGTEFGRGRTHRPTPFFQDLQKRILGAAGRVVLTGFIPPAQMPAAYLLGDLFVGPSQIEEGLGMVFLEASAAGLPIIATRRGGIPEVVRDGLNGLLLERHDDAGELAEKIIHLLQDRDLGQKLGRQGRQWVRENFSWERIAACQEGVYDEVLRGGPGR